MQYNQYFYIKKYVRLKDSVQNPVSAGQKKTATKINSQNSYGKFK